MGNPIKIKELAERMIRLSGNSVSKEGISDGIEIVYSDCTGENSQKSF